MIPLLLAAALAAEPPARPEPDLPRQLVALGASGGWDFATRQPFAAVDVAFHHDGVRGFAAEGRVQAAWAFLDHRPLGRVEAGFAGVVPAREVVRVGLVVGTGIYAAPYAAPPLQVGGAPDDAWAHVAFFPYGQFHAELGGYRAGTRGLASWAVGLRLGAGLVLRTPPGCEDLDECAEGSAGFSGGVTGRLRFREGAYVELMAGPTPFLSVGYAF